MLEEIYDIFNKTSDAKERMCELEKWYEKSYKNKKDKERKWILAKPFLDELVTMNFQVNTMAKCHSVGVQGGSAEVFVHLDSCIYHNKELIKVLLAIAYIWDENFYVYRERHSMAFKDIFRSRIEEDKIFFQDYKGDLEYDIYKMCSYHAPQIEQELIDRKYYQYLYVCHVGATTSNTSNSGAGSGVSVFKAIIW